MPLGRVAGARPLADRRLVCDGFDSLSPLSRTDPQIHTRNGQGYGSGNMGLRGMALFFANHRCNALCRELRCRPFARLPDLAASATLPGRSKEPHPLHGGGAGGGGTGGDAARSPQSSPQARGPHAGGAMWLADGGVCQSGVLGRAPADAQSSSSSSSTALVVQPASPSAAPLEPQLDAVPSHAPIHFSLALLHARAVRSGDETIGPASPASPTLGLFHLSMSARLAHIPALLACACLHSGRKPRKGVLEALAANLQHPLAADPPMATRYTIQAADAGVASAMCAAAYAYEHGIGVATSAARAVEWYRRAVGARGRPPEERHEEHEEEGERLEGGDASEHGILRALARLYEAGGDDLRADIPTSRQFEYLARASLRRDSTEREEDDEEVQMAGGGLVV